jgi:hypothetical protein
MRKTPLNDRSCVVRSVMLTAGFVPMFQRTLTKPFSTSSNISGALTGFLPRSSTGTF